MAALFERPTEEPADWYFERQVERRQLAIWRSADSDVVLDGDPFQPLWYNWAYDCRWLAHARRTRGILSPSTGSQRARVPTFYVLFSASIDALRHRKLSDPVRSRRNFEHHLRFIEPQQKYFAAMERLSPGIVLIVSSELVNENVVAVTRALRSPRTRPDSLVLFDGLINWLRGGVA